MVVVVVVVVVGIFLKLEVLVGKIPFVKVRQQFFSQKRASTNMERPFIRGENPLSLFLYCLPYFLLNLHYSSQLPAPFVPLILAGSETYFKGSR